MKKAKKTINELKGIKKEDMIPVKQKKSKRKRGIFFEEGYALPNEAVREPAILKTTECILGRIQCNGWQGSAKNMKGISKYHNIIWFINLKGYMHTSSLNNLNQ